MLFPESLKLVTDTLWCIKWENDLMWSLEDLLTPWEIVNIAERISILKMLKEWKSQREIADELWISITTVTRWNRILKYDSRAIHKYI